MEYKDQLKTSAWLRKRAEIMQRDNFVCSNCLCDNSECTLQVHHIGYIKGKKAWEYLDYMLVTLCEKCHKEEHKIFGKKRAFHWLLKLLKVNKDG